MSAPAATTPGQRLEARYGALIRALEALEDLEADAKAAGDEWGATELRLQIRNLEKRERGLEGALAALGLR